MLSARAVETLLSKLCVDLGFCLPPDVQARLRESPPADSKTFTDIVFVTEGLDPSTADRRLYRNVHELVADAFRRSEIDADEEAARIAVASSTKRRG